MFRSNLTAEKKAYIVSAMILFIRCSRQSSDLEVSHRAIELALRADVLLVLSLGEAEKHVAVQEETNAAFDERKERVAGLKVVAEENLNMVRQ